MEESIELNRIIASPRFNDVICGIEKGLKKKERKREGKKERKKMERKPVSTDNAYTRISLHPRYRNVGPSMVPLYSLKDVLRAFSHAITLK